MKHMAIIPARLASERLPQKPLQIILERPLIVHVAEEVKKTGVFDEVYVATDSEEVSSLFEGSEIKAIMTSPSHQSGTDRIYEAAGKIDEDFDTVFNIQGDEPFIYGEDLTNLKKKLEEGASMASLYERIEASDLKDLNKVKVLLDNQTDAIYFSRFGLPFSRSQEEGACNEKYVGKHIGVYAYRKEFLKSFCEEKIGYHESFEKLEQLRALQMGQKIKMVFTENSYQGVDTPEDLEKVNVALKKKESVSER